MTTFIDRDGTEHTDLAEAQLEIGHLRAALATRPVIDQAKGILMAQHRCSPERAFELLTEASQRDNRKVSDLAGEIVASAQRTGPPVPRRGAPRDP
jgi:AmiR/NasT family two-component response regulator